MAEYIFGRQKDDRRAAQQEYVALSNQPFSPNGTQPAKDPTLSVGRSRNNLNMGSCLVVGRIQDYIAYARTYKVALEKGVIARCCDAAQTGLGIYGARQINSYPLGTQVLVLYHPQAQFSTILCALPDWGFDPRQAISDFIVAGSNVGGQVDGVHLYPFQLADSGGIIDFSSGRPVDSLSGEWGAMAETGVGILVDPFLAYIRVDEETGFFVFYHDQLARFSGHNLQLRSAGYDREDLDDESEFDVTGGWTPYPWEALGAYHPADLVSMTLSAQQVQVGGNNRNAIEPLTDDQLGYYRERFFHGYLGQGGYRSVSVPITDGAIHKHSVPTIIQGLSEEFRGLDGTLAYQSANGIYLAKRPIIPQPKRMVRPENPLGDNTATNYKSCGITGAGVPHRVQANPANAQPDPVAARASAIFDQLAYVFNWKGLHPFHYHAVDWYLPEAAAMPQASVVEGAIPAFGSLSTNQFLPTPATYTVNVDERYGLAAYYAAYSAIALLPDGGVVIHGGGGEEIRLAGGTVYIHTPGDVIRTAGRSIVDWAGWDAITKANNCVDISANINDVRIKAENKVLVLGGNNGCGGVLIESRGSGTAFKQQMPEDAISGILLKAPTSTVALVAENLYLATSPYSSRGDGDGHIILDAGGSDIVTNSHQFRRHVALCAQDFIAGTKTNEYWANLTRIDTPLIVNGDSYLWGCTAINGHTFVNGRVFSDGTAALPAASPFDAVNDQIRERDVSTERTESLAEVTFLLANTDIAAVEFYFRTSTQYQTTQFVIHEPLWQQWARMGGESLPTWQENDVANAFHNISASYPGVDVLTTGNAYGLQLFELFANNIPVTRGPAYEAATVAGNTFTQLNGNWPVITQPTPQ